MREGWFLHRFDEVFNLQMGKTPDRKTPQYFGGDNVWVSIRDLVGKEISDSNEHTYLNRKKFARESFSVLLGASANVIKLHSSIKASSLCEFIMSLK